MIYFSEDVIEEVDPEDCDDQTEETAFVIITAKIKLRSQPCSRY